MNETTDSDTLHLIQIAYVMDKDQTPAQKNVQQQKQILTRFLIVPTFLHLSIHNVMHSWLR